LTVILFFNGLTMIGMGILGEYLARIFVEVKRRPLYLVRETLGFEGTRSTMTGQQAQIEPRSQAL